MKMLKYMAMVILATCGQSLMAMELEGEAKAARIAELKQQYEDYFVPASKTSPVYRRGLGESIESIAWAKEAELENQIRRLRASKSETKNAKKIANLRFEMKLCYDVYRGKVTQGSTDIMSLVWGELQKDGNKELEELPLYDL